MWHPILPISIEEQSHRHRLSFDNCKKNSPARKKCGTDSDRIDSDQINSNKQQQLMVKLLFKNLKFSTLGKRNVTESMNDDAMERG
jgi:hypothetical protein